MGKVLDTAIALMFGFFLVTIFGTALYTMSDDVTKAQFENYQEFEDFDELNEENLSYANTENSVSNMQLQAEVIANKIADAQSQLSSNNAYDVIMGAFGVASALTIDVLFLMLAIMMDGVNFISGIASNLAGLESPWNYFANLAGLGVALFVVFIVFKTISAHFKWDL